MFNYHTYIDRVYTNELKNLLPCDFVNCDVFNHLPIFVSIFGKSKMGQRIDKILFIRDIKNFGYGSFQAELNHYHFLVNVYLHEQVTHFIQYFFDVFNRFAPIKKNSP